MIEYDQKASERAVLEPEGQQIAERGSHEFLVYQAVRSSGKILLKELPKIVGTDTAKFGQGNALKNKWIKKEGDSLLPAKEDVEDTTKAALEGVRATGSVSDAKLLAEFKKKKLIKLVKSFSYTVKKGPKW
jgi:phenylalanyl-tRNA synthetase alpha chain